MMTKFFRKNKTRAFMTVEILVSAYIITLVILATLNIAQRSTYISRHTFYTAQGVFLAEEGAEAIRIMRDNNWTNISSKSNGVPYYFQFSGGTWVLTTNQAYESINGVKRKVIFHGVSRDGSTRDINTGSNCSSGCDAGTRRVNINANWTENGQYYDKLIEFYVMDIWP